ncbi:conserved hypothetical protein [Leptospira interrogans serovar Manilae]|uniref:Uncharacterized protein n=1 Tax=Leptospira interrogans serovar Manilae TaxID=214675 RepID=A0AAQ1NUR4_LEPIR|nr:conserved hypothetical protein [Leptospira interrogans serovar Manilae]
MLKNSIAAIHRTASLNHFMKQKQDEEFVFQQLYYVEMNKELIPKVQNLGIPT